MTVALDGNNPGGMSDGAWARSQPGYAGPNGRYASFHTLTDGVHAMQALLKSYIERGYNTPRKIANRWAPAGDGNDSDRYARNIAAGLGIGLDAIIAPADSLALTIVQAKIENGAFVKKWAAETQRVAALANHGSHA